MNTNTKLYVGLALLLTCFTLLMIVSLANITSMEKKASQKRFLAIVRLVTISEEWAYFQGQKEAMNGDVRIKYDEQTKKYSWTKSCWDSGAKPTFDPSQSEDVGVFLTKTNLTK